MVGRFISNLGSLIFRGCVSFREGMPEKKKPRSECSSGFSK